MSWSWLQSASAQGGSGLTVTMGTNVSSGTKLIAAAAADNSSATTVSSIKDGSGNAMTFLARIALTDGTGTTELWAMDTPSGDVGTKPVFTLTMSVGGGSAAMLVQEVSGLLAGNTTAMLDGTAGTVAVNASGSGSTTSPTYSSTAANEYLVLVYGDNGNSITYTAPSSPWTGDANGINTSFNNDCEISYRNSTNGAESGQYSINGGVNYGIILVAFKLAGGGGSTPGPAIPGRDMGQRPVAVVSNAGWRGGQHSR